MGKIYITAVNGVFVINYCNQERLWLGLYIETNDPGEVKQVKTNAHIIKKEN